MRVRARASRSVRRHVCKKLSSLNDTLPPLPLTEREIDMKMAEKWEQRGEMERREMDEKKGEGKRKEGGMRWKVRRQRKI